MQPSQLGDDRVGAILIKPVPLVGFAAAIVGLQVVLLVLTTNLSVYWDLFPLAIGPGLLVFLVFLIPFAFAVIEARVVASVISARAFAISAGCLALALALADGYIVLRRLPSSADEFGYLFEAHTFLAGRLWNAVPPGGQALSPLYVWVHDGKWLAQYPPGWPAVMAIWAWAGLDPWAVGTALLAMAMVAMYVLVRRRAERADAALAVAVFGVAPFTSFNAGSLFSHMLAATLVVAAYASLSLRDKGRLRYALAGGVLLGLLGVVRTLTAAITLTPILVEALRRRRWRDLMLICGGGLPFVAVLLWYQWRITGDPFRSSYYVGGREADHLYFHPYQIRQGMVLTWQRLTDLGLWSSPALVIAWAASLVTKLAKRSLTCEDLVFPLGVFVFVFYPFPAGNKFGPRYYYDFFPLMIYTVCTIGPIASQRMRRSGQQMLLMTILFELLLWPYLATGLNRVAMERSDLYDQVRSRKLNSAVVCVARGTGKTLMLAYHDLVRNDVNLTNSVLYANCFKISPDRLKTLYPARSVWIFRGGSVAHGRLDRLR